MIAIFSDTIYNQIYLLGMVYMDKRWYVYIVQCGDGTFYTGITDDVSRRLAEHNAGTGAKYTRGRSPIILRYSKQISSKSEALKEEYRIKQLPRSMKAELCALNLREGEK